MIGSHRIPEESKEGCCGKQDLKTEAQRTNRFDTNSNTTPCNHLENMNGGDEPETQEKDDLPCINIILKPVLNTKTEQTDKGVQIVEVTANDRLVTNTNTLSKETEKTETKCVKVQTEVEQNIQDSGTQTADEKSNSLRPPKQEIGTNERNNRSVQFGNNAVATCDQNLSDAPLRHVDCCGSMETLYKSVKSDDESSRALDSESHLQKTPTKLSDRIKRDIDKLETESCASTESSIRTETKLLPCSDTCRDIASQVKSLKTHLTGSDTSMTSGPTSTRDNNTLPSVMSNNSPIPRILIDTTELQSPMRNNSSRVTIGTPNTNCCSDQNLSMKGEDYSDDGRKGGIKTILNKRNAEKFNSGTETRGFWDSESETHSKSADTLVEKKSLESTGYLSLMNDNTGSNVSQTSTAKGNTKRVEGPDFVSSSPNARNLLTASDLTRPEFIRMLTELKEHTCSLEMQLFAMNEALKRKQATRKKVLSSTLKKCDEINEPFSPIEYARLAPGEVNACDPSCATPDDDSTSEDKQLEDDETCCSDISIPNRMEESKIHELAPAEKRVSPQESFASSRPKNCCDEPEVFKTESSSLIQPDKPAMITGVEKSPEAKAAKTSDGKTESEDLVSLCGLDSSKKSNSGETCCQGEKIKPEEGKVDATSPSVLKEAKVGCTSGLFHHPAKESPGSTPTNSILSKESETRSNDAKASPSRLRKGGAIPRLKRLVNRSRTPARNQEEKNDSQEQRDSNNGKDHIAYVIKTEHKTPFMVNNINSFDYSEEEVKSIDYGVNNSAEKNYAKERKDDANGRKRKRGNNKLMIEHNVANQFNTSDQVLRYSCKKNSQTLIGDRNILRKLNQNNSQHKDSKCTIRVTVSLDGTPSNEEV